jgi:hypothetical protein
MPEFTNAIVGTGEQHGVVMSKGTHEERLSVLERENADLRRRLALVELYLDSARRERVGVTADDIRATWAKDAGIEHHTVPEYGGPV